MSLQIEEAEQLIRTLSETRTVEVKRWFDPNTPQGKAKLVRGLQALRNYNGGAFVIGFDDATLQPDLVNEPDDVRAVFHADVLQELVSRYSSEPFDVEVLYPRLNERSYVVAVVPSGIRTPVAVKREIVGDDDRRLVQCNDVYFRTLQANHRVSSAKIPYGDWADMMRVCFDNREADIGSFVRRHLSGISPDLFRAFADGLTGRADTQPNVEEALVTLLDGGEASYHAAIQGRQLDLPAHGSCEVGLILSGEVPPHPNNREFLYSLDRSNPRLTGWPIWLDTFGFQDRLARPYVLNDGWEALVVSVEGNEFGNHIDFMRKEPAGRFYLRRALQDDMSRNDRAPPPCTELDFGLAIVRTAEAIAVGRSFATSMGCDPESTILEFAFRWKGLRGRALSSWANSARHLSVTAHAVQDTITCRVSVPLISAPDTMVDQTNQVVTPLFALFGGFELSRSVVEGLVIKLLERRL